MKCLQKREWIVIVWGFLKINNNGGDFDLNIRPLNFERIDLHGFAFIVFSFVPILYLKFIVVIKNINI